MVVGKEARVLDGLMFSRLYRRGSAGSHAIDAPTIVVRARVELTG